MNKSASAILVVLTITLCIPQLMAAELKNAIARLNYSGFSDRSHCTAALISKNAVLTAKHCLRARHTILFGYSKFTWLESRKAALVRRNPDRDIAIICLSKPSTQKPIQLGLNVTSRIDRTLTLFGYSASKPHILSKKECQIIKSADQTYLNCPLEQGMSGGPAIIFKNGKPELVGVASATSDKFSIMERIDDWVFFEIKRCD